MEYKKKILTKIFIAVAALLFVGAVFFVYRLSPGATSFLTDPQLVPPSFPPKIIGENKFYQSLLLRFSVVYPKNLSLKEYTEGNTSTMVFEDENGEKGFQIFVVPYTGSEVGAERFKMDIPSGVMEEPTDVLIDGVRATMFFSKNKILGDTREVWFINKGFLYEVTASREHDLWLGEIMQSFKFLNF